MGSVKICVVNWDLLIFQPLEPVALKSLGGRSKIATSIADRKDSFNCSILEAAQTAPSQHQLEGES